MDAEPTKKELEEIQKQVDKGQYFDEEFDDFSSFGILEEDFDIEEEDF